MNNNILRLYFWCAFAVLFANINLAMQMPGEENTVMETVSEK